MTRSQFRFKTILVATDLSDFGSCALRYARKIAQLHGSTLIILYAIDPASYAFPKGMPDFAASDQSAREVLKRFEEEIRQQGIPVHSVVESGVVYERILQAVVDHQADLLVLGTRATAKVGRVALGEVARRLLASAPCPILTVPPAAAEHFDSRNHWRNVLVATDFSIASLAALVRAQSIASEQLLVIHVTGASGSQDRRRSLERLRFLVPFNESHTVPVEHFAVPGEAGTAIAEHANRLHADLVVLGSPLNELKEEDFHSSTVLQVISNVNCPVLCVPPPPAISTAKAMEELALSN